MKKHLMSLSACLLLLMQLSAQFLDPTFGTDGKAGPFTNGFIPAANGQKIQSTQSMTIDNNGRLLIAGHMSNGTNNDFAVMRLNPDGTPDITFGAGGVQKFNDLTDAGNSDEYATAIVFNAQDNVTVIAGYRVRVDGVGPTSDIVVMQLFANGSVNNNFGQQGVRIIDNVREEEVYSIAFANDGGGNGIYLGGFTSTEYGNLIPARGRVWRMNNNGGSISSFSVDFASATCRVYSLAVDPSGNILAGGDNDGAFGRFAVARFFPNGTYDNSFDGDGKVFVNIGNTPFGVTQIKLQQDGKILLAGGFFDAVSQNNGAAVARLNFDGSVDNDFSGGHVVVPFNYQGTSSSFRSIAVQGDGKIFVSGTINDASATSIDFGLALLNTNATFDNTFGNGGFYSYDFGGGSLDVCNSILLQADGKLIAGAMTRMNTGNPYSAGVIRLQFTPPVPCSITGPDQVCRGGTISFNGPSGMSSYSWSITGNASFVNGTPTNNQTVLVKAGNSSTSFTLSLTVTNANNETRTCNKTVIVTQQTCEITGATQVCANTSSSFQGPAGMNSYNWSILGNATFQGANNGQTVTVFSTGGSYTLSLFAMADCIYECQKVVTVNPAALCDITGPIIVNALSTGNIYSGPQGMSTYAWSITGTGGTIVGATNQQTVSVSANASGNFTVRLITTLNGCNSTMNCQFPVNINSAISFCTYTQDVFSKKNNKGCVSGTLVGVTQIMSNSFGNSNSLVFGDVANRRFFTLYRLDVNGGNIFKMLPGFDGAQSINVDNVAPFDGAFYDDKTTWPLVPIPIMGQQKGQISNSLLSQLMTLWFNLSNNASLSSIVLDNDVIVTTAQSACGSNTPIGNPSNFNLPANVVTYLNGGNGYANTIAGLYQLANDALGGVITAISPSDAQAAIATINSAFNGCRILNGIVSSQSQMKATTSMMHEDRQNKMKGGLDIVAYPNPSSTVFSITVKTDASKQIMMQVVDMYGRIIEVRNLYANSVVKFGERYRAGTYFVRILQGSETKELKLVKLSD